MKHARLFAVLMVLVAASSAWAIDVQNIQPAMGPQNLLSLYVSDPLASGQFVLGMLVNYASGPLRFEYDNGHRLNVVDRLTAAQFYGAVGFLDVTDIMIGGSYNSVSGADLSRVRIEGLPTNDSDSGAGAGDLFAGFKIRLLKNQPHSVGVAVMLIGSFATGDSDLYLGAGASNLAGAIVLDKRLAMVNLVINAGYRYMGRPKDLNPSGEFFGGFGVDVALANWCALSGELVGKTVDYGIAGVNSGAPLEALAGFRLFTPVGLNFIVAAGFGLTSAIGSPLFRGMIGVSFSYPRVEYGPPPAEATAVAAPPPPPPPPPRDVYVDPDGVSHEVIARRPNGVIMLRDLFVLPQPLVFQGPSSAALTGQDKALLDQVASIMQQYPRVKIQIEGHVAAGVANAQKLTQSRAEAVLSYLRSRGIDASRMVAVGMGADVPVASNNTPEGRRRNTRIDFLIVEQ